MSLSFLAWLLFNYPTFLGLHAQELVEVIIHGKLALVPAASFAFALASKTSDATVVLCRMRDIGHVHCIFDEGPPWRWDPMLCGECDGQSPFVDQTLEELDADLLR